MATPEHPASLNPFRQYRQACRFFKETSRATHPAWYQEATELDHQLHIRIDGASISSFYYNRASNIWTPGPSLSDESLTDPEAALTAAREILKHSRTTGAKALGVVLHIADEFATAELKPELDNPAALPDLREAAFSSPDTVLDDSSVPFDQASWRVFPYPANASEIIGTTITLSRRLDPFVIALRELGDDQNFPIIPLSLSAPLVILMGLGDIIRHTPEKPFVAVLQYPWFTAMAFFNEHADIQLIRTLQHRGQRRPSNFRHALTTTNASLEFIDPDIFVLSLGEEVDRNSVADIKSVLPYSRVEEINFSTAEPIPTWMPELIISATPPPENPEELSHTFTVLRSEKWALQDFLPAPAEVIELYPSRSEMKLLRFLKLGRVGVFAVAVMILAWITFSIIDTVRRPEWAFNDNESDAVKRRLTNLVQERQRSEHWSNLLEDRSKAWISMEALARLFPHKSGLLVKTYTHTIKPDTAPGQAKVGFIKEWLISGLARDEALSYLNKLNTRDGITAHFDEVAALTGNSSFDSKPTTRSIVVNVRVQENPRFRQLTQEEFYEANEQSYPHTFTLSITQRFESGDPLALTATSAP